VSNEKVTDAARDFGGLTAGQIDGTEEILVLAPIARKYVAGKPLVTPEQLRALPTQMRHLHEWYMREVKLGRESLMVKVKEEHYFHECEVWIHLLELFQLFNMDSLDKSLVSCSCL
jgi:hypothetical protein